MTTTLTFPQIMEQIEISIAEASKPDDQADEAGMEAALAMASQVRELAEQVFTPYYEQLVAEIEKQKALIAALTASAQAAAGPAPDLEFAVPATSEEIAAIHKGTGQINSYSLYCMLVHAKTKAFPASGSKELLAWKGLTDVQKQPWKDAAAAYNAWRETHAKGAATILPGAVPLPAIVLTDEDKRSNARSAHNLHASEYAKLHKKLPGAGVWKNLSDAEKAPFEARIAAIKAYRAANPKPTATKA